MARYGFYCNASVVVTGGYLAERLKDQLQKGLSSKKSIDNRTVNPLILCCQAKHYSR